MISMGGHRTRTTDTRTSTDAHGQTRTEEIPAVPLVPCFYARPCRRVPAPARRPTAHFRRRLQEHRRDAHAEVDGPRARVPLAGGQGVDGAARRSPCSGRSAARPVHEAAVSMTRRRGARLPAVLSYASLVTLHLCCYLSLELPPPALYALRLRRIITRGRMSPATADACEERVCLYPSFRPRTAAPERERRPQWLGRSRRCRSPPMAARCAPLCVTPLRWGEERLTRAPERVAQPGCGHQGERARLCSPIADRSPVVRVLPRRRRHLDRQEATSHKNETTRAPPAEARRRSTQGSARRPAAVPGRRPDPVLVWLQTLPSPRRRPHGGE